MPLSALIGLAGSLLGSELQHQKNRENFDYMQRVNTPAAQIARFRQAGINPAMMMLNPTVSSGNVTSPPDNVDYAAHINNGINAALSAMQMRNLVTQNHNLEEDTKAKRIENKVAEEEGKARIAEAKEREADANARKIFGDTRDNDAYQAYVDEFNSSPPDDKHEWVFSSRDDSDFGFWYYKDDEGRPVYHVGVPNLWGLDRRTQRLFTDYNNQKAQLQAQKIQNAYAKFQEELYRKFGDKMEQAKLNQANAIIRNQMLNGDLTKIDVDTFKKLGLGPNVIRALVSTAQAFGGQLNGMIGATEMLLK